MKRFTLLLAAVSIISLTACETVQNSGTKQTVGAVSGAVIGGVLGSKVGGGSGQMWATGAGAVIGGLLGSEIGRSLDRADRMYLGEASQRAQTAPIGETVNWSNPQSGNYGSVTPTRDGYSTAGRYCREYKQTIYVGGREETAVGQACQQPDGTWQIVQ
jgi:surface antigen